jgi:hypothetical protein
MAAAFRVRGHTLRLTVIILSAVALAITACGDDASDGDKTPTSSQGAKFLISPDHGAPDARIFLSACGLDPNATVTIEASDLGTFPQFTTDADGAFHLDTQVPSIAPGTFIVRVSTSETVFAETMFEIEQQGGDSGESPVAGSSPQTATC